MQSFPQKSWIWAAALYISGGFRKEGILFDNGVHLRRFLTSRWTLEPAHQDMFDNFLTKFLAGWFKPLTYSKDKNQTASEFLNDVLGLPLQVPHTLFMKSIISGGVNDLSIFLDTVHREAIEEGLKMKDKRGGMKLWNAMRGKFSDHSFPEQPSSEAVDLALSLFKTKREMEMEQREGALEYLAPLLGVPPSSRFLPIILDYEPLFDVKRKIKTKEQVKE